VPPQVAKLPLGKLSKPQLSKGMAALAALEAEARGANRADKVAELCGRFYTCIPHASAKSVKLKAFSALHEIQVSKKTPSWPRTRASFSRL
jgi:hypothetical protein